MTTRDVDDNQEKLHGFKNKKKYHVIEKVQKTKRHNTALFNISLTINFCYFRQTLFRVFESYQIL